MGRFSAAINLAPRDTRVLENFIWKILKYYMMSSFMSRVLNYHHSQILMLARLGKHPLIFQSISIEGR